MKQNYWTTDAMIEALGLDKRYKTARVQRQRLQRLREYARLVEGVDYLAPDGQTTIYLPSGFKKMREEEARRRGTYSDKGGKPFRSRS